MFINVTDVLTTSREKKVMGVVNHITYGRGLSFHPFNISLQTWCQRFKPICQILIVMSLCASWHSKGLKG